MFTEYYIFAYNTCYLNTGVTIII